LDNFSFRDKRLIIRKIEENVRLFACPNVGCGGGI
jgi:hypothetical protein